MSCCNQVIEAAQTVTKCECKGPGHCDRHQCGKTAHFHEMCRTRPDYFRLWEQGQGPGQVQFTGGHPARFPLGTWLATAIKLVTFGRVKPCTTCKSRAAKLDRLGMRFMLWLRRAKP